MWLNSAQATPQLSFQDHWIGTVQNAFRNTFWGVAFGTRAERRNSPVLLTIMYYTYYLYLTPKAKPVPGGTVIS